MNNWEKSMKAETPISRSISRMEAIVTRRGQDNDAPKSSRQPKWLKMYADLMRKKA